MDLESNHEVMTQDNLATINENPEIVQHSKTNSKEAEEEKQINDESFENLEFKLDPQPVPEHKQRPQSMKPPIIGSNDNVNNVSLDDVPDIDHCDQTISSLGSHRKHEDS